jgi:hypothetical protein
MATALIALGNGSGMPDRSSIASAMPPKLMLVLGMHRSGTSAVTGLLGHAGFALPSNPDPPDGDNPTGYWEPRRIRDVHDQQLIRCQSWWDDPLLPVLAWQPQRQEEVVDQLERALAEDFAGMPADGVAIVKDPRQCRLMPLWLALLERHKLAAQVLLVVRRPEDVVASLARRDNLPPDRTLLLWLTHTLEAELHSRSLPRLILSYESLLRDPAAVVKACQQLAGLPEQTLTADLQARCIQARLNHGWVAGEEVAIAKGDGLLALATAVYEAIQDDTIAPQARQELLQAARKEVQERLLTLLRQGGQRSQVGLLWEPSTGEGFRPNHAQQQMLQLEHNRMDVTFELPPEATQPRALHIQPANRSGLLAVQRLELRNGASELLWQWSATTNSPRLQAASSGIRVLANGLLLAVDSDPWLKLAIPASSLARVNQGSCLRLHAFWQPMAFDLASGLVGGTANRRFSKSEWLAGLRRRLARRLTSSAMG